MTPARRRWFRVAIWTSIWTMLLAPVIPSLWVGYHLNWIHQRRALGDEHSARMETLIAPIMDVEIYRPAPTDIPTTTRTLALFGESPRQAAMLIFYADERGKLSEADKLELERAARLFPESMILWKLAQNADRIPSAQ